MDITMRPVAYVRNTRKVPTDDHWGNIITEIELAEEVPSQALTGITEFSHLEVIFHFDKANPEHIVFSGRPRNNPSFPEVGIFAQRKKDRPNGIGLSTAELVAHNDRTIIVKYLDAIDGTPVLDIKPVYREFEPKGEISQPDWVSDLAKNYW